MRKQKDYPPAMIEDAKILYLKYGGRMHARIEREMRAKGWPFYRSMLYAKRRKTVSPGWIERFGWIPPPKKRKVAKRRGTLPNHFAAWLKKSFPEWVWTSRYQRYVYDRLAAITSGESRRLMIFMPPRHGKSETVTVRYTAWRLLQDPKLNVILASYNQKLADKFSRKIKRIVGDANFSAGNAGALACKTRKRLTGPGTGHDDRLQDCGEQDAGGTGARGARVPGNRRLNTAAEWETSGGGTVRSVGVGGGIAGFGAGLIVIDDPVRNRADAESETYRDRVYEWFNDDIYTRMEPNAAIILIQTRWHEDDLAGRLLKEMENGGEKWDVVSLPALAEGEEDAETGRRRDAGNGIAASPRLALSASIRHPDPLGRKPGHALCPRRFNAATLLRYKQKLGSYSFSALYQQSPVPMEGGRFKRAWFKNIVSRAPDGLRWKRGYDLAVSLKTSADYTASYRCAYDEMGNLYIDGGFRKRIEYPEQRRYIIDRMKSEVDTEHGIESAIHGKAVVQELRRQKEIRRFALCEVPVKGDKLTRALAWLNLAEEGKVILVRGPWNDEFVDEVCRFPDGRYDDQVDAVSLAVNMLSRTQKDSWGF